MRRLVGTGTILVIEKAGCAQFCLDILVKHPKRYMLKLSNL
jgi:hypothetical protein